MPSATSPSVPSPTARSLPPVSGPAQLREAIARDGFAPLGRILSDAELGDLRAEEARLRGDQSIDSHANARTIFINNVSWRSEPTRRLVAGGAHLAAVRAVLGDDLLMWWTQYVTKLPEDAHASSVFPWHQDCGYNDIQPTPMTVWIALDDTDEANGCLWIVPGSHAGGLLSHQRSATSWHLTVPVAGDGVCVPMRAGEAVLFTGYTLHRSLANRSGGPRRAFFCEYTTPWAREALTSRPLIPERDMFMVAGSSDRPERAPA